MIEISCRPELSNKWIKPKLIVRNQLICPVNKAANKSMNMNEIPVDFKKYIIKEFSLFEDEYVQQPYKFALLANIDISPLSSKNRSNLTPIHSTTYIYTHT